MAAFRTPGNAINQDDAVIEEIDWFVFYPTGMSKLEALQMSSFASRAFEMAMPPRRSSLPSRLRSVSLTTETPLRQRARSREMPSSNRPRVGPPRSPASSATRRDPELLPVSRAAEPLSRPACHTRCESPVTPQAASIQGGLLGRFKRWSKRPPTRRYGMPRRRDRGCYYCRNRPFKRFLTAFCYIFHNNMIQEVSSCCNI